MNKIGHVTIGVVDGKTSGDFHAAYLRDPSGNTLCIFCSV
jgi:hypothetical protein